MSDDVTALSELLAAIRVFALVVLLSSVTLSMVSHVRQRDCPIVTARPITRVGLDVRVRHHVLSQVARL